MHGASTALRDAAAVFGAGKTDELADRPQQRHITVHVERPVLSVHIDPVSHFKSSMKSLS
jgi:hypothetical protein